MLLSLNSSRARQGLQLHPTPKGGILTTHVDCIGFLAGRLMEVTCRTEHKAGAADSPLALL